MKKTKKIRLCYRFDIKAITTSFDTVINLVKTRKDEGGYPTLLHEVEYDKNKQPIAIIFKIPTYRLSDAALVYEIIYEHTNKSTKLITTKLEVYK